MSPQECGLTYSRVADFSLRSLCRVISLKLWFCEHENWVQGIYQILVTCDAQGQRRVSVEMLQSSWSLLVSHRSLILSTPRKKGTVLNSWYHKACFCLHLSGCQEDVELQCFQAQNWFSWKQLLLRIIITQPGRMIRSVQFHLCAPLVVLSSHLSSFHQLCTVYSLLESKPLKLCSSQLKSTAFWPIVIFSSSLQTVFFLGSSAHEAI